MASAIRKRPTKRRISCSHDVRSSDPKLSSLILSCLDVLVVLVDQPRLKVWQKESDRSVVLLSRVDGGDGTERAGFGET